MIETAINIILFIMLVVTALAIIRMDKLFAVVMLSGVFSFLSALLFIVMDAVDVAFTEAAVGAGITTVLMLGTIALTARTQKKSPKFQLMPVLIIIALSVLPLNLKFLLSSDGRSVFLLWRIELVMSLSW